MASRKYRVGVSFNIGMRNYETGTVVAEAELRTADGERIDVQRLKELGSLLPFRPPKVVEEEEEAEGAAVGGGEGGGGNG